MTVAEAITNRGAPSAPELISLLDEAAKAADRLARSRNRRRCRQGLLRRQARQCRTGARAARRPRPAWVATYVEALVQVASYAKRMQDEGRFGEMESLLVQIGAAEYAAQLAGGVMMSQGEMARLYELGVKDQDQAAFLTSSVRALMQSSTPKPAPASSS